jgi:hypothetical protein
MKKLTCCFLFLCSINFVFGQENKPKILAIYPTTDSIPVNILRFYIQFSAPMQEMNILKHIQLRNEEGKNMTGVFFENQYELWDENRTTVTLIIDPGRVKLGLLANNKMGRAFDEGKKYSLTIDSLLLDFNDQKLSNSFSKTFVAVKADTIAPDTKKWELELPKVNTYEPIVINFKDKIDHISVQTLIKIVKDNIKVEGKITLQNGEQKAIFTPKNKWKVGDYQVIINPRLEDIAANSVNQIFDHKPSDFKQNNLNNFIINFLLK